MKISSFFISSLGVATFCLGANDLRKGDQKMLGVASLVAGVTAIVWANKDSLTSLPWSRREVAEIGIRTVVALVGIEAISRGYKSSGAILASYQIVHLVLLLIQGCLRPKENREDDDSFPPMGPPVDLTGEQP